MNRIFITGDIHGDLSIFKLEEENVLSYLLETTKEINGFDKSDICIILGDFGIPFVGDARDRYLLDWLDNLEYTVAFIDGNHENFNLLKTYPQTKWNGGDVRFLREHVIYLSRGQVFRLNGYDFFTMGGAHSIDKKYRTENVNWWSSEVPSDDERKNAIEKIERTGKVDFVLTHDCPSRVLQQGGALYYERFIPNEFENWLDENVAKKLNFDKWFFGHLHTDMPNEPVYVPLYNDFVFLPIKDL